MWHGELTDCRLSTSRSPYLVGTLPDILLFIILELLGTRYGSSDYSYVRNPRERETTMMRPLSLLAVMVFCSVDANAATGDVAEQKPNLIMILQDGKCTASALNLFSARSIITNMLSRALSI